MPTYYTTMGGGKKPRLSIIIVSFNTKDITDDCLASIFKAKWNSTFEVIVVDNNSHDGSVEMIREKYPQVHLIANPDNRLFAIANNQGAKIATGDYLLLLNSDTIVYDDNLQRMIDFFDTLPDDVICIGPKILNADKTIQSYGAPKYGYAEHFICQMGMHKRLPFLRKIWKTLPISPDITHEAGWVSGSCMMIPRDKYLKVGGLNEKLEFYGEEPEFGFRTQKLGYRTIYFKDAEIIHLGGVSTSKEKNDEQTLATNLRRYDCLVSETNGFKEAITITRITIIANRIKTILSRSNRQIFLNRINHERKVVEHLRNRLKELQ